MWYYNAMKKLNLLFVIVVSVAILLSCSERIGGDTSGRPSGGAGGYVFESVPSDDRLYGTSKVANIWSDLGDGYGEECALIYGRLLTRFGDPLYTSMDLEMQYEYAIEATGPDGEVYFFSVYSGSTGPAIGGKNSQQGIDDAAAALVDEINSVTPADYDYEGYYMDGPSKVTMGVKDGEPYYNEVEVSMDEMEGIYDSIYDFDEYDDGDYDYSEI